jgi:hypothetical protein
VFLHLICPRTKKELRQHDMSLQRTSKKQARKQAQNSRELEHPRESRPAEVAEVAELAEPAETFRNAWLADLGVRPLGAVHAKYAWGTPPTIPAAATAKATDTDTAEYVEVTKLRGLLVAYHCVLQLVQAAERNDEKQFTAWAAAYMSPTTAVFKDGSAALLLGRWEVCELLNHLDLRWHALLGPMIPILGRDHTVSQTLQWAILGKLGTIGFEYSSQLLELAGHVVAVATARGRCLGDDSTAPGGGNQPEKVLPYLLSLTVTTDPSMAAQWFFDATHVWLRVPWAGALPGAYETYWRSTSVEHVDLGPLYVVTQQAYDHMYPPAYDMTPAQLREEHDAQLETCCGQSGGDIGLMHSNDQLQDMLQVIAVYRVYASILFPGMSLPAFPFAWVDQVLEGRPISEMAVRALNPWLVVDAAVALLALQVQGDKLGVPADSADMHNLGYIQYLLHERVVHDCLVMVEDLVERASLQAALVMYIAQAAPHVNVAPLLGSLLVADVPEPAQSELLSGSASFGSSQVLYMITRIPELASLDLAPVPDLSANPPPLWPLRSSVDCSRFPGFGFFIRGTSPAMFSLRVLGAKGASGTSGTSGDMLTIPFDPEASISTQFSTLQKSLEAEAMVRDSSSGTGVVTLSHEQVGRAAWVLKRVEDILSAGRQWNDLKDSTEKPLAQDTYQISGYEPNNKLDLRTYYWLTQVCPDTADVYRRGTTNMTDIAKLMEQELVRRGTTLKVNSKLPLPKGAAAGPDKDKFPHRLEMFLAVSHLMGTAEHGDGDGDVPPTTAGQQLFIRLVHDQTNDWSRQQADTNGRLLASDLWDRNLTPTQREGYVTSGMRREATAECVDAADRIQGPIAANPAIRKFETERCEADKVAAKALKAYIDHRLAADDWPQVVRLWAQCTKLCEVAAGHLNLVWGALAAASKERGVSAKELTSLLHFQNFVDIAGRYFAKFPLFVQPAPGDAPGDAPAHQQASRIPPVTQFQAWVAMQPDLVLKATAQAKAVARDLVGYTSRKGAGVLAVIVLVLLRDALMHPSAQSVADFRDKELATLALLPYVADHRIRLFAIMLKNRTLDPNLVFSALDALLLRALGTHLIDKGPFEALPAFINWIRGVPLSEQAVRDAMKGSQARGSDEAQAELAMVVLLPADPNKDRSGALRCRRLRLAQAVLRTRVGQRLTIPMHRFRKNWDVAVSKCSAAFTRDGSTPDASAHECLRATVAASRRVMNENCIPASAQALFLPPEGDSDFSFSPPPRVEITVTQLDIDNARSILATGDCAHAPTDPVSKAGGGRDRDRGRVYTRFSL